MLNLEGPRKDLDGVPVNNPEVLKYIADTIKASLKELRGNIK